jgi:hypothetical protein
MDDMKHDIFLGTVYFILGLFFGFCVSCLWYLSWPITFFIGAVFARPNLVPFAKGISFWLIIRSVGAGILIGGLPLWLSFPITSHNPLLVWLTAVELKWVGSSGATVSFFAGVIISRVWKKNQGGCLTLDLG